MKRGVILKKVRLSDNPDTEVVECSDGIGGQANKSSDGAMYIVLELEDNTNLLKSCKRVVNYRQRDNGSWPGADPATLKSYEGEVLDGAYSKTFKTTEYQIDGKTMNTFSTIVLPHENEVTVVERSAPEGTPGYKCMVTTEEDEMGNITHIVHRTGQNNINQETGEVVMAGAH